MSTIRFHKTTTASPEQFVAGSLVQSHSPSAASRRPTTRTRTPPIVPVNGERLPLSSCHARLTAMVGSGEPRCGAWYGLR
jgi:hypothetical protein